MRVSVSEEGRELNANRPQVFRITDLISVKPSHPRHPWRPHVGPERWPRIRRIQRIQHGSDRRRSVTSVAPSRRPETVATDHKDSADPTRIRSASIRRIRVIRGALTSARIICGVSAAVHHACFLESSDGCRRNACTEQWQPDGQPAVPRRDRGQSRRAMKPSAIKINRNAIASCTPKSHIASPLP